MAPSTNSGASMEARMSLTKRRFLVIAAPLGLLLATAAFAERVLTPQESLGTATDFMKKMQDTSSRIGKLQDIAKRKKDAIKLNCVNDKYVQVKGHLAVADGAMGNLNTAIARANDSERNHELTRMTILYEKVLVLGTEAENCVGEE